MGNKCIFEATVLKIHHDRDHLYVVHLSPSKHEYGYHLSTKNPHFAELYNKCKKGETYRFIIKDLYIIDMQPLSTHYICGQVQAILDVKSEYPSLDYHQIILDQHTNHRLLIKADEIEMYKTYKFYYEKAFGHQLYLIKKYEQVEY